MSDVQMSELGAQNNLNVVQPPMAQGGGVPYMRTPPTTEEINRAIEEARRQRIEYFAQQIYITAAQSGQPRDATQCAKDAKALYAELDKVDAGEGFEE